MFNIEIAERVCEWRKHPCTLVCIRRDDWPGNEFGLWLPEDIKVSGKSVWNNWEHVPAQRFERRGDGWITWTLRQPRFMLEAAARVEEESECLRYRYTFTNTGDTVLEGLGTQTCFQLFNAPQFISIDTERYWASLDGRWRTLSSVPAEDREQSPDPRRLSFLRAGVRSERTVIPRHKFPSATMPQAAHHPLLAAESFDRRRCVGVAASRFRMIFNNNDPILRCLHSESFPIEKVAPGQSAVQEAIVLFANGDHEQLLERYRSLATGFETGAVDGTAGVSSSC